LPRLPSALVASGSARKSASPFLFFVAALHTAGDCSCPTAFSPCCIGLGAQVGLALFVSVASLHTAVACSCPDCLLLMLERSQRVSGLVIRFLLFPSVSSAFISGKVLVFPMARWPDDPMTR